jgi:hypothetical protein
MSIERPKNSVALWRERLRGLFTKKLIWRRLAFLAEAIDRFIPKPQRRFADGAPTTVIRLEDARVLVTIAHWRYPGRTSERRAGWDDDEILLTCIRRLVAIPTVATHVVVLTNDAPATERSLSAAIAESTDSLANAFHHRGRWKEAIKRLGPTVTVLQPKLRWPRHKGPYLTWTHKSIFREALDDDRVTHFVYLEDDIGLTEDNLRYWMDTRPVLESSGLIPGFLLFEWFEGQQFLIQQTESGQHRTVLESIEIPCIGAAAMHQADLPYHASYIMDRRLATEHFTHSAFRSPFRSRIASWGNTERAASGPLFGPSTTPLLYALRLGSAPYLPQARNAVPLQGFGDGAARRRVPESVLLEHLRANYSSNPESPMGKLGVAEF